MLPINLCPSRIVGIVCLLIVLAGTRLHAADWIALFNGRNMDGWESVGTGRWSITSEGNLLGQWDPFTPPEPAPWLNGLKGRLNRSWLKTDFKVKLNQAWLYTRREFSEYLLHLEWRLPKGANSGIALHDPSRGRYTFGPESDLARTPSQIAYEVQIVNQDVDDYPTGSIYMVQEALKGFRKERGWNSFDLHVRRDLIRVRLNGHEVAQGTPVLGRPESGPIGIQLHDPDSIILLRNIRIRELTTSLAPAD